MILTVLSFPTENRPTQTGGDARRSGHSGTTIFLRMSDLHSLLAFMSALAVLSVPVSLRSTARRLHYRDRPLFWRALLPLADATLSVVAGLLLAWALYTHSPDLLWLAAALSLLTGVGAWWIGLEPQRLVRHR